MRIAACRVLFAFAMSATNSNTETNSNNSGSSSSVWPTIELPANPAIHYVTDHQQQQETTPPIKSVESLLNYCDSHVTHMQTRRDVGGTDSALEGASWISPRVMIRNARLSSASTSTSLAWNGFQLVSHPMIASSTRQKIDFKNSNAVLDDYYPLCEQLLKETTGAAMVHAFDHNVRVSGSKCHDKQGDTVLQQPIGVVHNDYTHVSAPRRLEQLAQTPKANDSVQSRQLDHNNCSSLLDPEIVKQVLAGERRFCFINVWRNMDAETPVQQFPLACAAAHSCNSWADVLTFQIMYKDRIGENYFAHYQPRRHEWNYFPHMTHDEALLIKQWDSHGTLAQQRKEDTDDHTEGDSASFQSTFALHSAFQDPTSPKNAPPRQSIEVRCVLIWDKEDEKKGK